MGVVYKALDTRNGETVAVKFLQDDSARDGSVLDRLIHEVGLVRKLRHPNICQVLCLQAHEGRPFMAMEILRGPDLSEFLIEEGGRIEIDRVLELMKPVAAALDLAHSKGVIHLDLKPQNIKFRRHPEKDGELVILDFGLAQPRDAGKSRLGGSRAYRPPEQSRASRPRPAHDIYAFAVTVYELLAGAPPHLGEDLETRKAKGEVPPIPGYGWSLHGAFLTALSPRMSDRPASATAFLDALDASRKPRWMPWILLNYLALAVLALLFLFGR
jgi:serine/threonine-protein kinase